MAPTRQVIADPPLPAHGGPMTDTTTTPTPTLAPGVVDDYCATAYVYCIEAQPVPKLDLDLALADIARRDYEPMLPQEALSGAGDSSTA